MALKGKELVEKKNVLNELRRNSMTLQELRFFSIYLSKINARDVSTRKVIFPVEDFQKIMEIGRVNIQYFKDVTDGLLGKVVSIPNEDGRPGYTSFQLFKRCKVYQDDYNQWQVEIDAHDEALPLMFEFKRDYFTYELWNALRLKSSNQVRMYEILKQYEKLGERKLPLPELRELLGIAPDEYPRWNNFRTRVLDSCQDALAETSDIWFDYTPIKAGHSITGVKFTIHKNENYIDQLTLAEFIDLQGEKDNSKEIGSIALATEVNGKYKDQKIDFLAEAFNKEFSEEETRVLVDAMLALPISFPDDTARFDFLRRKYNVLALRGDKIKYRFKYLLKVIKAGDEE